MPNPLHTQQFNTKIICSSREVESYVKIALLSKLPRLSLQGSTCILIDFPFGYAFQTGFSKNFDTQICFTENPCKSYSYHLSDVLECELISSALEDMSSLDLISKRTLISSNLSKNDFVLSPRLRKVIFLLSIGLENKMISKTLGISEKSVHSYIEEIFRFVRVEKPNWRIQNRTQLALWFWGKGFFLGGDS
jgi:DNA-binding CsgD family transcriptional regulator